MGKEKHRKSQSIVTKKQIILLSYTMILVLTGIHWMIYTYFFSNSLSSEFAFHLYLFAYVTQPGLYLSIGGIMTIAYTACFKWSLPKGCRRILLLVVILFAIAYGIACIPTFPILNQMFYFLMRYPWLFIAIGSIFSLTF